MALRGTGVLLLLTLAACGGGSSGVSEPPAVVGTLAYVAYQCRNDGGTLSIARHALRIRQGEGAPVTVAEFADPPLPNLGLLCSVVGQNRINGAPAAGGVQRLGVSHDGSVVIFEATNAFSILPVAPLPPEQEGIFVVHADGSGLRRLSPASREPCHITIVDPSQPSFFRVWVNPLFVFSPDGRVVAYTDLGPGPDGEEATQIVTLDLDTGARTQITHLPFAPPPDRPSPQPPMPATTAPWFQDNDTMGFSSFSNPDGLNPEGIEATFFVKRDGQHEIRRYDLPAALPGSLVVPQFQITAGNANIGTLNQPGVPDNALPGAEKIQETFLFAGDNWLQLTNFHRWDTYGFTGVDPGRAFIVASTDRLGTNPNENCQLFSISRTGTDLRQLTRFTEGRRAIGGCGFGAGGSPPECFLYFITQDARTAKLVFGSNCDPLGANPYGSQLFSMRPDGTGMRQLTDFHGYLVEEGGAETYEWPGTFVYAPWR